MRRIFLGILILLPFVAYSQRFKGGLLLGINASQIDGDSWYGYNKAGLNGGAFIYTQLQSKWAVQMEIEYSAKGSASQKKDSLTIRRKFVLRYVQIPILVKYDFAKYFQAQAGVSFGYLFYAGQNDGYGYEKLNLDLKPLETALCIGVNFAYFHPLDLNLRYSYSVMPIYDRYPGASYAYGDAWYNNIFSLSIYYHIGIESK